MSSSSFTPTSRLLFASSCPASSSRRAPVRGTCAATHVAMSCSANPAPFVAQLVLAVGHSTRAAFHHGHGHGRKCVCRGGGSSSLCEAAFHSNLLTGLQKSANQVGRMHVADFACRPRASDTLPAFFAPTLAAQWCVRAPQHQQPRHRVSTAAASLHVSCCSIDRLAPCSQRCRSSVGLRHGDSGQRAAPHLLRRRALVHHRP